jgi:hypothetical protein
MSVTALLDLSQDARRLCPVLLAEDNTAIAVTISPAHGFWIN